jgi:tetratricopeptide (TPR) repeat protein
VQRPADEVLDEALAWLDKEKDGRFFSWIHLYDPHTPYEPPAPYDEIYAGRPYNGEIAYTDSQLGRLWDYLEKNNLVDNTIVVFASDHGESLGEHQEGTHGFFIYQEGIHVPLIFVTPFAKFHGLTCPEVVSLVDIMPTMLEMADIPIPAQVQGESLLPYFDNSGGQGNSLAYAETYYPRFHYGWSELKSIQGGRYKLIIAPELELYDLTNDPDEAVNLVDSQPAETRRLMRVAEQLMEAAGQGAFDVTYHNIDEEAREKLTALGYIGSFVDPSSLEGRRPGDPKEKIVVFNQLSRAKELRLQDQFEEAERLIKEIIQDDPDIIDAYFTLGNLYFRERKFQEALDSIMQVLEKKPGDAFTAINIANCYMIMGEHDEAERFLLGIIDTIPPDSQINFLLGNIKNINKEFDEAIKYYNKCIELNPSSASAYCALGGIYIIQGEIEKAEENLKKALDFNPKLRNLQYNYAQIFEAKGDMQKALEKYKEELENIPYNFKASFNLSRLYRLQGMTAEEEKYLEKTKESNPNFPLSYFYLARIYLNRSERFEEAVELVNKGIELKPEDKDLPLGYFLLADLYNRLGDSTKSAESLRKAQELVQK